MLALTFQGQRTIKLDTVPLPQLLNDTDVIVKVLLCSICGR
jgi:threonine dehydrogenase-like Zn-dependent dehydrogenase